MKDSLTAIREHFCAALECDGLDAQLQYAADQCSEMPEIRAKLEEMLRAHHQPDGFLVPSIPAQSSIPGDMIGPYTLREQLAEGGMGVVFVAEQSEPVKRKVALKIIKAGMATKDVVARFQAECQALALMDHPHIAQVYDAGATESGLPFFVMELVRGIPITEFCDERQFTTGQRLQLFIDVCRAIQHAHQKGVIHRDIKPSNVLVTLHDDTPVVKVIDFGVAKAINQELTQQTLYTRFAQMVGTPLYMSPEQAEMNALDVDTRSDVYSLGVLLYELITGATPFDRESIDRVGFDEMRRIIREVDPPRPSQRITTLDAQALSTTSKQRGLDGRQLGRMLRGDLDWIVMKALEKDRTRRYETANELAADAQRFLNDEPVEACPPSPGYQLRKLLRRHQSFFLATSAVVVALTLGVIATSWQALVANRAKISAQAAEQKALAAEERATRNLQGSLDAVEQMLSRVGYQRLENTPRMEEVRYRLLEDAVRLYDRLLQDAPDDPQLQRQMAITQRRKARVLKLLGRREEARGPIEQSIKSLRKHLRSQPDSQLLKIELARSLSLEADVRGQLPSLEEAASILGQLDPADGGSREAVIELAYALSLIASQAGVRDEPQRAEQTFREAQRLFKQLLRRNPGDQDLRRRYAKHVVNFSQFLGFGGNWQLEEQTLDQAVAVGQSLVQSDRTAEDLLIYATALLNRAVARFKKVAGPTLHERGGAGRFAKADEDLQIAGDLFKELVRDYPAVPLYRERLAATLANRSGLVLESDFESALKLADESLAILARLAEDYPAVVNYRRSYGAALSNVANTLLTHGREPGRAEQLARQAIEQQTKALEQNAKDPTTNQYLANHYAVLAELLIQQEKPAAEVIEICSQGLRVAEPLLERYPDNAFVAFTLSKLRDMKHDAEAILHPEDEAEADHDQQSVH